MTPAPPAIRVAVNDRQLPIVAVFEKGRVLVPLRAVVEALGGSVRAFHLPLPPPARIIAGRTYAPIRTIASALHAQIQSDARAHLVQVFTARPVAAITAPTVTYTSYPLATTPPQQPGVNVFPAPNQLPLQLNVYQNEITGGDSINVQLMAPPGGQAYASVCTSSYEFPLYANPGSQYYSGYVSTRRVSDRISCQITARYIAWNGAVTYAPYPAFIELLPFETPHPHATPTPTPTPEQRHIPLPPIRRATPEPTATPTPQPTRTARPAPPRRIRPDEDPTAPPQRAS